MYLFYRKMHLFSEIGIWRGLEGNDDRMSWLDWRKKVGFRLIFLSFFIYTFLYRHLLLQKHASRFYEFLLCLKLVANLKFPIFAILKICI